MEAVGAGAGATAEAADTGAAVGGTATVAVTAMETAAAGEAEAGDTSLGEMQQLQRNRQGPVQRLPEDGLPVACKRYIRRAI